MGSFSFSLVCPEGELLACQAEHVIAPGEEGEFGVMEHHAAFVSTLKTGLVRVLGSGKERCFLVRQGFAGIAEDGMIVLADEAMDLSDADPEQIKTELAKAVTKTNTGK